LYSNIVMKSFKWSERKNKILQAGRGVSFEDVMEEIAEGRVLDMLVNTNHSEQIIYVVRLNGYVHCVPAEENEDSIRLITIYPSRKLNSRYKES